MAKIKDLEMAHVISSNNHISISKSLFGMIANVVYTPTGSKVKISILDYTPDEGQRLARLLDMPVAKMVADVKASGKPQSTAIGHYRLEACVSQDARFCALQLFTFADFHYNPVLDAVVLEGDDAATVSALIL